VSVARDLFPQDATIAAKVAKAWADVGVLEETSPATALANVTSVYVIAPRLREVTAARALPTGKKKKVPPKKAAAKPSRPAPKKKARRSGGR
jgi:hypothetical protein